MTAPVERARKLIALALNNPSEEEARSAALVACRHIRQHGLELVDPATLAPRGGAFRAAWVADFEATQRRAEEELAREARRRAAAGGPAPSASRSRRKPKPPKAAPVVVEAMTPCARGPHTIDAGKRMWRVADQPGLVCGLCWNGAP